MHPPLETLRRQFFALVPPYLLRIPDSQVLASPESQQWLVDELIAANRLPEAGYRRVFWRKVLPVIERGINEGDEDAETFIYDHSPTNTTNPSPTSPTSPTTHTLTLLEEQVAIQSGTTGLRTWTAALHLGHHVLQGELFTTPLPPAIELGAGTGFLSILWAQLGGDVLATDLDGGEGEVRSPLEILRRNIGMNETKGKCEAMALDWAQSQTWDPSLSANRVILAADVIYDPDIVPLLVGAIAVLLQQGKYAVLSATVRNEDTFKLFLETCEDRGLKAELLDLKPMDPEDPTFWDTALDKGTRVEIVRVTRG